MRSYALPLVVLAALVAVLAGRSLHHAAPADPEHGVHYDQSISFAPGLTLPIRRDPLYAANDPWKPYLADEQTCPNAEDLNAPLHEQALTMTCLINHARRGRGLATLPVSAQLSTAVRLKGAEIIQCKVFAHAPCGGDAHDVADQAGFAGSWGENLYIADGRWGAPRPALDGWLNSPGHRENLFRPEWQVQSVYVVKLDSFPGFHSPTLWVSEFGA
ncbi:MAG: Allergen V5/Tpx related [Actinomycetia bacterium]|nr:Allergen V5/Tpx related [Actinomycetes bacterium]